MIAQGLYYDALWLKDRLSNEVFTTEKIFNIESSPITQFSSTHRESDIFGT